MKRRFSKSEYLSKPLLSHASLPNLIFLIIFFFLAMNTMKTVNPKVQYNIPQGDITDKIDNINISTTIYVGKPIEYKYGSVTRVQIDNRFYEKRGDIYRYFIQKRAKLSDIEKDNMQVILVIDKETKMNIVNQIKQELKDASVYKVVYLSNPD